MCIRKAEKMKINYFLYGSRNLFLNNNKVKKNLNCKPFNPPPFPLNCTAIKKRTFFNFAASLLVKSYFNTYKKDFFVSLITRKRYILNQYLILGALS